MASMPVKRKRKTRRRAKKAASVPYNGQSIMAPFADAWNKGRAPSPIDLLRENLGIAFACMTLNADLLASTRLGLYVKTRNGEGKSRLSARGDTRKVSSKGMERLKRYASKSVLDAVDVEEVTNHPALALLDNPNQINEDGVGMSGFNLFNLNQQFQEIIGRAYWWVEKKGLGNTPSAIWILASQRVEEVAGIGNSQKIIDYYRFSGNQSGTMRYETEEVIPFRMPDLYNVYTGGMSPLRAVFEQVRLARKVDAQTNAMLDNGGKPSAIWSPSSTGDNGGFIGAPEAERMRRAIRQAFAMAGAGGIMVAETAGALSVLNWPMKDIIDASRMELSTDTICAAFGVPTTKIKRNEANRASASTGDYAHAKDAGLPRCRRNEAALNAFYLPMWGPEVAERLFFAYDDPPGLHDEESERTEFKDCAALGGATRNEYRERVGLAPVPWGDQPLAPNTMAAVDLNTGIPERTSLMDSTLLNLGKSIGQQAEATRRLEEKVTHANSKSDANDAGLGSTDSRGGAKNGHPVQGRRHNGDDIAGSNRLRDIDSEDRKGVTAEVDSAIKAESPARTLPDGAGIKSVMLKVFHDQRRAVMTQLEEHHAQYATRSVGVPVGTKAGEENDPKQSLPTEFIPLDKWTEQIVREARPVIEVIMRQEGNALLTRVGASPDVFSVFEKNIPKAAQELTLNFAESTNATTSMKLDEALATLRTEISDGLVQGDTRLELGKRVNEIFDEADASRAQTIAQTEASRAAHNGELMSAKESGVVSGKYWMASADACLICLGFAAQGTIGLDKSFGEDDYGVIDAPPGHPNCNCSQGMSVKDDRS